MSDDSENILQEAQAARDGANTAKGEAEAARDGANTAKGETEAARDGANAAKGETETARDGADAAKGDAETARDEAGAARDGAVTAEGEAETARDGAVAAKDEAEDARNDITPMIQTVMKEQKDIQEKAEKINNELLEAKSDYEASKKKIDELLPDARVAVLATAFRQSKLRYGKDPMEKEEKEGGWTSRWKDVRYILPHVGFSIAVLLLVGYSLILYLDLQGLLLDENGQESKNGQDAENGQENLMSKLGIFLAFRLPFLSLPIWLIFYFKNIMNRNLRLYEEYNYKQRIVQFYDSFAGSYPDEEKLKVLDKVVDIVGEPPSVTIDLSDSKRKSPNSDKLDILKGLADVPQETLDLLKRIFGSK